MPCYSPIPAWYSKHKNENGKRNIVFNGTENAGIPNDKLQIPCGQCIGCRTRRARGWAIRLLHESKQHQANSFITLTYKDCPRSLDIKHLQLFFKALRHHSKHTFRYFAVGEYGAELGRPHYHALIFGYDFPDKKYWKGRQYRQYRSATLEKAWPHGHALTGTVTPASIQYVSKYSIKQITGTAAPTHYDGRTPEFATMSRRPGIGATWIDKYKDNIFPRDFIITQGGKKVQVPRYYLTRQPEALQKTMRKLRERLANKRGLPDWWDLKRDETYQEILEQQRQRERNENEATNLRSIRQKT